MSGAFRALLVTGFCTGALVVQAASPFDALSGFLDAVPVEVPPSELAGSGVSGPARDRILWRRGGQTVADLPQLQAYLNRVLRRLAATAGDGRVAAQVFIAPSASFGAFALPNGAIFVNLGTLLALQSEDELGALLGHELAHLRLGHHGSDDYRDFLDRGIRLAGTYLVERGNTVGRIDPQQLQLASWVSQTVLFPAWSRVQEDEADRFGLERLLAAGYNADAMVHLLRRLAEATERRQQALAMPRGKSMASELKRRVEQELAREHRSAQERQQTIRQLLKGRFRHRPRPPFEKQALAQALSDAASREPLALYRAGQVIEQALMTRQRRILRLPETRLLYESQRADPWLQMLVFRLATLKRDRKRAAMALQRAHATGEAPYLTYRLLAEQAVKRRDLEQAGRYLEELNVIFDYPAPTLPLSIRVQHRLGRPVLPLQLRCRAVGDERLVKACNVAAKR